LTTLSTLCPAFLALSQTVLDHRVDWRLTTWPASIGAVGTLETVTESSAAQRVRLHIVSGKGGTGKTTVAAVLALALASRGSRVLLCEVEGRQGIASLFDVEPLPYEGRRIAVGPARGEVFALAVDAESALREYLDSFYHLGRAGKALDRFGVVDFATTVAPGVRDVLLIGKVYEAVRRREGSGPAYDAVVLDAPPTGRIGRFLNVTAQVAMLARVGPIKTQSDGVMAVLRSPMTAVHLVTLLEEMPVQETLDATAELRAAGYRLGRLLVNRARPALVPAGRPDPALLAQGLAVVGLDPALAPALAAEVSGYGQRQDVQARAAADLEQAGVPIIRLPELPPPLDLGSLYELADALDVRAWSA
jgi:anion-transporting  ArsA/GET3 family ATPase